MGDRQGNHLQHIPHLRSPNHRPFCNCEKHKMPQLLLQSETEQTLPRRYIHDPMAPGFALCVPPNTTSQQGPHKDTNGPCQGDPDCPIVAETIVVPLPHQNVNSTTDLAASHSEPFITATRTASSPQSLHASSQGLVPAWFSQNELAFSDQVQRVLLHSRTQSTHTTYLRKWTRFAEWCSTKQLSPTSAPLPRMLNYLLDIKQSGLSFSSIRIHLTAITTFHDTIDNTLVFTHPITKRFLKRLQTIYPDIKPPTPPWDLHLVLSCLTQQPFEPLATCSLLHLSMKTAFLVAITSARQAGEIAALKVDPPYTLFFKDKVTLRLHPKFLPKVQSTFLPLTDICKAATWSSEHTFVKHYALTQGPLSDTRLGRAVISTAFLSDPKSLPP